MMAGYWEFLRRNSALASFGFLCALGSSFGQTFFIGVFSPSIQSEFGLSHTEWSSIYLVGTLASAALLPWSGRQIDRLPLRTYALAVWLLLAIACAAFSLAPGVTGLAIGIFLLRQGGQGLMSHLSLTSMARYFERARGRAIALASLGFAVGEAVLPLAAVFAIEALGWRWSYRAGALALLAAMGPALWLLRRARHRYELAATPSPAPHPADTAPPRSPQAHSDRLETNYPEADIGADTGTDTGTGIGTDEPNPVSNLPQPQAGGASARESHLPPGTRDWTRSEVVRDPRFYCLLPGILCPSVVITAMFFHHLNIADLKGWSPEWVTGCYLVYALASTITSLVAGQLIDRFGAVRVVPAMLIPQGIGLLFVASFDHPGAVVPYLALIGVTTGISHTVVAALWAELYGVGHIGAVRSLAAALSVFGSALGPVTLGGLMDLGASAEQGCLLFAVYCLLGTVLIKVALALPVRAPGRPAQAEG